MLDFISSSVLEIIEFLKKSRLIGGQSSSGQSSSSTSEPKYHDYFQMKGMVSLTNVEITIEDSEVSVDSFKKATTFKRFMLQKAILENNIDPEVIENLEIISTIQNKASEFYKNSLVSLTIKELSLQLSKFH